jgi:tetratricopeptide (TPR) repeat protein
MKVRGGPRRGLGASSRAGALALLAGLLLGCRSSKLTAWESEPGAYDRFAEGQLERLEGWREAIDRGRASAVLAELEEAQRRAPENLELGALLQDARLSAMQLGGSIPEVDATLAGRGPLDEGGPTERLRRAYAAWAAERGTARAWVLAARIEPDAEAALWLLQRALEVDPDCLWAHYGRAHNELKAGRLQGAQEALARALEIDPGHPRARRLEATLLGLVDDDREALRALERWLAETEDDPRVSERERMEARLDRVGLELDLGRFNDAAVHLDESRPTEPEAAWRAELYRAVAAEALGRAELALEATRRARQLKPSSYRAWVQEALLLEYQFDDPRGALEAWRRAQDLAGQAASGRRGAVVGGEASTTLIQARVAIARLERGLAAESDLDDPGANAAIR